MPIPQSLRDSSLYTREPWVCANFLIRFSIWTLSTAPKKGTFSCVLSISSSAELDQGRCPLDPCELLKKLDQNFSTCGSSFFFIFKSCKKQKRPNPLNPIFSNTTNSTVVVFHAISASRKPKIGRPAIRAWRQLESNQ